MLNLKKSDFTLKIATTEMQVRNKALSLVSSRVNYIIIKAPDNNNDFFMVKKEEEECCTFIIYYEYFEIENAVLNNYCCSVNEIEIDNLVVEHF